MRGVSFWFLAIGAVAVLIGMIWGIRMSATHDHTLSPAHAHLNLVGWVTFALFGFYYHAVPTAVGGAAKLHLALATLGLVAMVPGIALAVTGQTELLAIAGSFLTLASMALFVVIVLRNGFGRPA